MNAPQLTGAGTIVWLASYPKSGNTWLRAMLTHLLAEPGQPFSLNALVGPAVGGDRHSLDDACGISSAEMTAGELLPYRALLHCQLAADQRAPFFVKTHDQFSVGGGGNMLFPASASLGAIYLVRDPLDIAISYSHHSQRDVDATIAFMADRSAMLNQWSDRVSDFLPVLLGRWCDHVMGWTRQTAIPTCVLRYEDMLADPAAALARVARAVGIDTSAAAIADAVAASGFDVLRANERAEGFVEKPSNMPDFFRSGRAGTGRDMLLADQVTSIISSHGEAMAAMGYSVSPKS